MNQVEEWRDIDGFEGLYQVSNLGEVKSLQFWCGDHYVRREKVLKKSLNRTGYYSVSLSRHGVIKRALVHRLVGMAFIENPNNLPYINHKDHCRTNNHISNLEWCTPQYNQAYASKHGRMFKKVQPQQIIDDYESGMSGTQVALKHGIDSSAVYYWLKKSGVPVRSASDVHSKYKLDYKELGELFKQDISTKAIAEMYGCSYGYVRQLRAWWKKGVI